jgi:anaerobic selenocysteine-containing dehydrogenase/Fe-S-cluster-containing dehydrogenase component
MIRRRDFLKNIGLAGSATALEGCSRAPVEKLIPYLVAPEDVVPGVASFYSTVCRECPAGCGMLAKTREGRVIKVEGNPAHPVSQGKLCIRGQSAVQSLYNPDRFRGPMAREGRGALRPVKWEQAEEMLASRLGALRERKEGGRIAWLGAPLTGSMERLTREWLTALGSDRRLFYEPFGYESLRSAAAIATGRKEIPAYHFERAAFVVSFGADFLETWISSVRFSGQFSRMRRERSLERADNFVHVGPRLSMTGSNADWWIPVRPGTEVLLALALAHAAVTRNLAAPMSRQQAAWVARLVEPFSAENVERETGVSPQTVRALAEKFCRFSPSLAVGADATSTDNRSVLLELAVLLLNLVAGNLGETVTFGGGSPLDSLATYGEVQRLIEDLRQERIDVLLLHDANPVFTLPESSDVASALEKVPLVVSFARLPDESAEHAHLVFPDSHFLESWGDYSPEAGCLGVQQPAMQPLYDTRPAGDVLLSVARLMGGEMASSLDWPGYENWMQSYWNDVVRPSVESQSAWEDFWPGVLGRGGHFTQRAAERIEVLDLSGSFDALRTRTAAESAAPELALVVYPSAHLFDGRGANNPWLQEIPDPVTKGVWDGWVEIHPQTAERLGIKEGSTVVVESSHGKVSVPVFLYAGLHPGVVAMQAGRGRSARPLRYASGTGASALRLLPVDADVTSGAPLWRGVSVKLSPSAEGSALVRLQVQIEEPAIPVSQWMRPGAPEEATDHHAELSLYPAHAHPEHRWGMAIDADLCTGCNACVAACYAENNVPIVGKEMCAQGREMAWIRIERYQRSPAPAGDVRRPGVSSLPMLCQQCDNAPCESVCPVFATYHNPEGLNAQVYNRCVGTRYCGNNCPYKVRRFEWTTPSFPEPLHLQLNPDVTVRTMGVMEKCTFCVQRIQDGKQAAKGEGRRTRDGDIVPACAQTCPADAIVFGDMMDRESRVVRMSQDRRAYRVLESLNTRPAVTYLKKIVPDAPFIS